MDDRDPVLDELPESYAVALRLVAAGAEPELIATALGIEAAAVETLLDIARAKVRELDPGRSA